MNKLNQKIIDFCLDNENASEEELSKGISSMIMSCDGSEGYSIHHEKKHMLDIFGMTEDQMNGYIEKMNAIIEKNSKMSYAFEEIMNTVPKHIILLNMSRTNEELNRLNHALRKMGIKVMHG